ncbi:MAG: hypothetical protein QOF16_954 [Actinomycetota bacterium]|jgi:hypothetical protein|nr:hypothetical protein [Actinomycetota bacterium]MEA2487300.1 hypothetical protein [Actinomycetota bacterium]
MSRAVKVLVATLASVFVLASVALAALPTAGATYKGATMDKGHVFGSVKLVAETSRKLSVVRVKDHCGKVYRFHDVKVGNDGSFKAVKKNSSGGPIFTIDGQFTSASKAKGGTSQYHCQGAITTYVAKKQ